MFLRLYLIVSPALVGVFCINMNKQKSKALKQLGRVLPDVLIARNHTEQATLSRMYQLIDEGRDIQGLPTLTELNKDEIHSVTYPAFDRVNHHKRLKAAWTKEGVKGVQKYIKWVGQYNLKFAEKYSSMQVDQVDSNLLEIAKSGISSFWKMLIAFLFGFVQFFQDDKNKAA